MSLYAERSLAMLAADDGDLEEADQKLTCLVERLQAAVTAAPTDDAAASELSRCLLDRANVRQWAMRPAEALRDLNEAEPLIEQLKPFVRNSLRVALLDSRARLLAARRSPLFEQALAQQDVDELRRAAAPGMAWIADAAEAELAGQLEDWPRAAVLGERLVPALAAQGQHRGVHAAGVQLARALAETSRQAEALPIADQAHAFFAAEGPPDIAAQAALVLARSYGDAEHWALAEEALATIEDLTRAQRSLFNQQRYLANKLRVYDGALQLALEQHAQASAAERQRSIGRAWAVAERAKSFSLRQAMTQGGFLRAVDPAQGEKLAELDGKLDALEARGDRNEADAGLRRALSAQRQALLEAAMQRSPRVARAKALPFEIEAFVEQLPPGTAVVCWYWLPIGKNWRLLTFYTSADRKLCLHSSGWDAELVDRLAQARRTAAAARPFRVAQMLPPDVGGALLAPEVRAAVVGCDTLLLSPHRHLQQIPLHAMQLPSDEADAPPFFLVERWAVQVVPTLALPFTAARRNAGMRRVLLLGCTQDGFSSPRLADIPAELEALRTTWSAVGVTAEKHALAPDSGIDGLAPLSRWCSFDLIHLACHGRFVPASPFDAALYLGRDAVRASEFFPLELDVEVICLSACDVGRHSDALDGLALVSDEWLGLALPLFQAGARHLLTSLWQADSATASTFMQAFHHALAKGLTPAHAHRQACLAHLRRPYGLWANWQLAGFTFRTGDRDDSPIPSRRDRAADWS